MATVDIKKMNAAFEAVMTLQGKLRLIVRDQRENDFVVALADRAIFLLGKTLDSINQLTWLSSNLLMGAAMNYFTRANTLIDMFNTTLSTDDTSAKMKALDDAVKEFSASKKALEAKPVEAAKTTP